MSNEYAQHDEYQMRGAASHAELVVDAARRIAHEMHVDRLVFADYGCAQGRVSDALIRRALETLRDEGQVDVPVFVYHNDVLVNDWAALFERLRGDGSYLDVKGGPITPLASATSFYEHVTPPGHVHLGVSFAAAQWLARPGPAGTGTALYFDQLEGTAADDMAEQAHRDWCTFLERRAVELAPGGRMVLDMMGRDATGAAGHQAWKLVRELAEQLVDEGRLSSDALDGYVFPVYERTLDEVRRPFDQRATPLWLEHAALTDVNNPASDRYADDGDAAAFAQAFVGFFRAFSEPSLKVAIDPDGQALAELYSRMEARLREQADTFEFVVHPITLVISRADETG